MKCIERSVSMGRDEHTKGGKNAKSLPQTPKNQKLSASQMREEISKELAALNTERTKRKATKNSNL